ncbi:hypothetical protein SCATT_56380 [Streptantibioticus cattleyicolor NRRL 8057 = DSM 46488]|uniref:Uncharacterized protein n=1 Tax=Streptantibioticus cattleyicolor (strain ATCC 35852 / DSM 46488 / JCM 4925 / NBRC 14057 / NRRL 8057) TaxID=1003195 RepID=G8X414_STREN|nr:hypothetical protein SCATT_56380 [Streptantibioticus cattleyicolor NRRL 8057 = DSM 46488]
MVRRGPRAGAGRAAPPRSGRGQGRTRTGVTRSDIYATTLNRQGYPLSIPGSTPWTRPAVQWDWTNPHPLDPAPSGPAAMVCGFPAPPARPAPPTTRTRSHSRVRVRTRAGPAGTPHRCAAGPVRPAQATAVTTW